MAARRLICLLLWFGWLAWMAAGCMLRQATEKPAPETIQPVEARTEPTRAATILPSIVATFTQTPAPSATPTPIPSPSASPTITATQEPYGCQKPTEDYTRLLINGWAINRRTHDMLQHAAELYGGELEITGYHITQGSYHDNGAASFGTHLGGGAVDLSVMRKGTYTVLWEDVDRLIYALRVAGFAAWLRSYGELSADSPIHIHAIAIGDRELSLAAQDQLTGRFGYFRGYSGVPIPNGTPAPDRHNGPILCQWMIDLGYVDMREP